MVGLCPTGVDGSSKQLAYSGGTANNCSGNHPRSRGAAEQDGADPIGRLITRLGREVSEWVETMVT